VAALVAVLVLAGAGAGWAYVQSQYYVGADAGQVAVFRGVTGTLAGLSFSSVEERSDLRTDQLGELDAARVRKGIVAKDKADARQIVQRLKSLACPTPVPAPVVTLLPTPLSTPAATPLATARPTTAALPSPSPTSPDGAAAGCVA
jgi:protein phosphatase